MTETQLEHRKALPADFRALIDLYPRADWASHPNVGGMAAFWLTRHDMFRGISSVLGQSLGEVTAGRQSGPEFMKFFMPRLEFFLSSLRGHHEVEDMHYFPVFAAAEPKLKRGFDMLDRDHHVLHDALDANADGANGLLAAKGKDAFDRQLEAFAGGATRLVGFLGRHLEDEEDLIIPLILDRGDAALGGI